MIEPQKLVTGYWLFIESPTENTQAVVQSDQDNVAVHEELLLEIIASAHYEGTPVQMNYNR